MKDQKQKFIICVSIYVIGIISGLALFVTAAYENNSEVFIIAIGMSIWPALALTNYIDSYTYKNELEDLKNKLKEKENESLVS